MQDYARPMRYSSCSTGPLRPRPTVHQGLPKVGSPGFANVVRPTGSVHSWRAIWHGTRTSRTRNGRRRNFGLRPTDPKCWGRRFGFCSEGPRTGVEYDTRDRGVTKVLGVFRIATRVPSASSACATHAPSPCGCALRDQSRYAQMGGSDVGP